MTWDKFKEVFADLARPFGLYALGLAIASATIIIALKVKDGNDGAILIGAVGLIFGGAYGFRAWENVQNGKQAAQVEIAKATQDQVQ